MDQIKVPIRRRIKRPRINGGDFFQSASSYKGNRSRSEDALILFGAIDEWQRSTEPVPARADLDAIELGILAAQGRVGDVQPAADDFESLRTSRIWRNRTMREGARRSTIV